MLFIMCKQLVGSSGKGLGLGGISIKSKVQIPMGVNNSLGLACPIRMEGGIALKGFLVIKIK